MAIALFIADHPPPGFILIIFVLVILAFVVYIYSLAFIPLMMADEKHLLWKNIFHWVKSGAIVGLLLCLLPRGEPSMEGLGSIYDKFILLGVIVVVSVISGVGLYIINGILIKRLK